MSDMIVANSQQWYAKNEALYTMICGDDGNTYIRTLETKWEVYTLPCITNDVHTISVDNQVFEESEKDKQKPKRVVTSYNKFLHDTLLHLRIIHPEITSCERMKIAAKMWHAKKANIALAAE
jgi:hypothetical protein